MIVGRVVAVWAYGLECIEWSSARRTDSQRDTQQKQGLFASPEIDSLSHVGGAEVGGICLFTHVNRILLG